MKDLNALAKELSELTFAEASELGKILEEKYNIKPSITVQPSATIPEVVVKEEQTMFDVIITEPFVETTLKLQAVKALNPILALGGLKQTKELLDSPVPIVLKTSISRTEAESLKDTVFAFNPSVELR
jgi:large subunit ribosomal protein L7/L12